MLTWRVLPAAATAPAVLALNAPYHVVKEVR
jgi:hypothetical protein